MLMRAWSGRATVTGLCAPELSETLPPHTIEAVLAAYREEGHRLQATAHGIALIGRAMRGEVFNPAK